MQPIRNPAARLLIYLILLLYVLYSIIPFVWSALQSVKTVGQANARTPLIIFTPTADNYVRLWLTKVPDRFPVSLLGLLALLLVLALVAIFVRRLPFPRPVIYWSIVGVLIFTLWLIPHVIDTAEFYFYFTNSLIITAGTIAVSLSAGCLAGYALARYAGIAGVVVLVAALAFRALPRMAFLLPYYWMGQTSGLYDTYFLVIVCLVAVNQPFTIWMLRSFFMEIPREIEESAMVDGCGRLAAFLRVILPITWPGVISTGLFTMLLAYNEFLLVRILTQSRWTLPVAIAQYTGGEDPGHVTLSAAAAISASIPIVVVILFFQKQLVKGLVAGAVKG